MERINKIINHKTFRQCLLKLADCEKGRLFCRHDFTHLLDVARIAWIWNMEEEKGIDKELIYAAALLHDCGKYLQYMENIPHERASSQIAGEILPYCGFSEEETNIILDAIGSHRNPEMKYEDSLRGLLYRADKKSRCCFLCEEEKQCDWEKDKKNLLLQL